MKYLKVVLICMLFVLFTGSAFGAAPDQLYWSGFTTHSAAGNYSGQFSLCLNNTCTATGDPQWTETCDQNVALTNEGTVSYYYHYLGSCTALSNVDFAQNEYFLKVAMCNNSGVNFGAGSGGSSCDSLRQTTYGPRQLPGAAYALDGATGPQGPEGPQGPAGATGAQGPQGPIGLTGPQGLQGDPGVPGAAGANGVDGKTVLNGAVDPTTEGVDGDFYINTASNTIFGPKAAGAWPTPGTSLVGPQGPTGLTGPQGPEGPQGSTGATGPQGPQGPIGLTGPQGPEGPQGPAGTSSWTDGVGVVTTTQKVGVGTTTPDQMIQVKNDQNNITALRVDNANIFGMSSTLAQEQFVLGPNGAEHLILQVLSDSHATMPRVALLNAYTHDFYMRTNAVNVFKIIRSGAMADTLVLNSGNAGIGTSTPTQKLEVNGGVRVNPSTTRPVCDSTSGGTFWYVAGGPGVKDSVQVCAKDAANAYAWRTIY